ncbi:excinuclease ABC subunit UvrC [Candidatus Uhrbacteria bacterium]|nr:excinuclease ABC subunit UvrC [Candidatus Uhrbacteria bacterium]
MISEDIDVKNNELPDSPGVYFYFDKKDKLLYIGKATSLKRRVGSYFTKAHDRRIAELVGKIARIDYIKTPSVIEALVLEANQIKAHKPKYNILQRDDKSFLYLMITNEDYPRPLLMRGHELKKLGINPFRPELTKKDKKQFLRVFGPYTSSKSLRTALDLVRRTIPWSDCQPPEVTHKYRPCFNAQIGKCAGVCGGLVEKREYKKIIRRLTLFFDGKKKQLLRELKREMLRASVQLRFEQAGKLKRQIFSLDHIQDVALVSREESNLPYVETDTEGSINLNGRIEAYDISNISGAHAVGSMVVFEHGKPAKALYRKFKIKGVEGPNDVAMMEEVMRRRLRRAQIHPKAWPLPEIMVIDGGKPQVNRVQKVLDEMGMNVPIVGLAKGFDRKQDRMVYDRTNEELLRVARRGKDLFQKARDEAHRFAISYHRKLRSKNLLK